MQNPEPDIVYEPESGPFAETSEPAEESFMPEPERTLIRVGLPKHAAPPASNRLAKRPRQIEAISLTHHEAHCTICHHPDREVIDQAFLHWQRSSAIAHIFKLGDRRVVYRHARAVGLHQLRASKSRRSLEFIMEQAESVVATADSVVRAVRAHACIAEDGRWIEPAKRVIITHEYLGTPAEKSDGVTPSPSTKALKFLGTLLRRLRA